VLGTAGSLANINEIGGVCGVGHGSPRSPGHRSASGYISRAVSVGIAATIAERERSLSDAYLDNNVSDNRNNSIADNSSIDNTDIDTFTTTTATTTTPPTRPLGFSGGFKKSPSRGSLTDLEAASRSGGDTDAVPSHVKDEAAAASYNEWLGSGNANYNAVVETVATPRLVMR
jgi:hypothetical protein